MSGSSDELAAAGQGEREDRHEHDEARQQHERGHHAVARDEGLAERSEQELAHRARRGRQAERPRAPVLRHEPGEGREHDHERAAGEPEPDQHAAGQRQLRLGRADRHQCRARRVQQPAHGQHAAGAVAVRDPARDRLAEAPDEVLDRDRERERLAIPPAQRRQRVGEQAEARAHAERDQADHAARDDHQRHAPAHGANRSTASVRWLNRYAGRRNAARNGLSRPELLAGAHARDRRRALDVADPARPVLRRAPLHRPPAPPRHPARGPDVAHQRARRGRRGRAAPVPGRARRAAS